MRGFATSRGRRLTLLALSCLSAAAPAAAREDSDYPSGRETLVAWLGARTNISPGAVVSVTPELVVAIVGKTMPPVAGGPIRLTLREEVIDANYVSKVGGRSSLMSMDIQCEERRVRMDERRLYAGPNLTGSVELTDPSASWVRIPEGSIMDDVARATCDPVYPWPLQVAAKPPIPATTVMAAAATVAPPAPPPPEPAPPALVAEPEQVAPPQEPIVAIAEPPPAPVVEEIPPPPPPPPEEQIMAAMEPPAPAAPPEEPPAPQDQVMAAVEPPSAPVAPVAEPEAPPPLLVEEQVIAAEEPAPVAPAEPATPPAPPEEQPVVAVDPPPAPVPEVESRQEEVAPPQEPTPAVAEAPSDAASPPDHGPPIADVEPAEPAPEAEAPEAVNEPAVESNRAPQPENPAQAVRTPPAGPVFAVQIGAYRTVERAEEAWQALRATRPILVEGLMFETRPVRAEGRLLLRGLIRDFASPEAAASFCSALAGTGYGCILRTLAD